ncbi:MAG: ABC transporter substrate-binding protein [Candidatus Nanopelagicales bacterium]|jgi:branched-chain amino acid transport system substrate-binding protein|nr:ABC transporter substrate-binding protein [Candidatus Nanopelagicales bacterium]
MKMKKSWIGVVAAATLLLAACSSGDTASTEDTAAPAESSAEEVVEEEVVDEGASGGVEPLNIHIVAAKTGIISPFDIQPAEAFTMAIDEINAAGGIAGQQATVTWTDTKSDPALTTQIAEEAVAAGANIIVTTCDFDFAAPAATVAQANNIPALSLCLGDRKGTDLVTIGPMSLSPSPGNAFKGSAAAEFAFEDKGWTKAYVLQDDLLEYTKSLGEYFKGRFTELGGEVIGEDVFTGNEQLDPAANVTRARDAAKDADVIIIPSVVPAATTMIKAIRDAGIDTPIMMPGAAVDGTLVTGAIPDISEFYSLPFACMPAYCEGDPDPDVKVFADAFVAKTGIDPYLAYAVLSYELGKALKAAVEQAGATDGPSIIKAFETLPPTDYLTGPIAWSETCHHTTGRQQRVVEYQNGKGKFVTLITPDKIAAVDPGNPCEAAQSS